MNNWETASECSTGPEHAESGGASDGNCASEMKFLEDAAAGVTITEAMQANASYYDSVLESLRIGAVVTNHANAGDKAMFNLTSATCFMTLSHAKNKGRITVNGGANTVLLVHSPTNYADADVITLHNASVYVLGGTNAGPIDIDTTKKVEVYGVNNSGPITIRNSQDVVVASVYNGAAAQIDVTDLSASLIDVENHGNVTINGQGGMYNVWNAINHGVVTVNAGTFNATMICPSDGTVTIAEGVTGEIAYEEGCRGTITAPSTVTIREIAAKGKVVSGTIEVEVTDPEAFLADTSAMESVREGIAEVAGVPKEWVSIQGRKASRRLQGSRRRLAANLELTYTIECPADSTSSTVARVESRMKTASTTEVESAVKTKLAAKSVNSGFVAKSIGTPVATPVTTTTTTSTTTSMTTTTTTTNSTADNDDNNTKPTLSSKSAASVVSSIAFISALLTIQA